MWGPLIGRRGLASVASVPVHLALDQQHHAAGQQRNLAFLPRHDIGQVIDRAGQMGDAFLECGQVGHTLLQRQSGSGCKGFLAPVPMPG